MLNKIRDFCQPETPTKASRITNYIRGAVLAYLVIATGIKACECKEAYETEMISEEIAEKVIKTLTEKPL